MDILEKARSFIGTHEGDKKHKEILDNYAKIEPLPRGYKVTSKDAWCATFVSFLFWVCGFKNFPFECSCSLMVEGAKKKGIWEESDNYIPRPGDCVLYDWQDSGIGDCKGSPDHIGIIENVTKSGIITVIEGNIHDSVDRRKISVNGRYIRGFIKSADIVYKIKKKLSTKKVVADVIQGKYGVGNDRKRRLELEGYDYKEIQTKVNKELSKGK